MKKIASLFVVLFAASSINAQTCNSHVITYDGPHNSNQLERVLNESTNPAIVQLDAATKASIVTYMDFKAGMPTGFSGLDDNLRKFISSDKQVENVMSAILGNQVIVTTFDNKPVIKEITMQEWQDMYRNDPMGSTPRTATNWCSNCNAPDSNVYKCCEVATDPRGCLDFFVVFNGEKYKIK